MSDDQKLLPGQVVERYTVEARIGKGGVARVYRVRHNTLGSHHALKVLHLQGESMRYRMVQEGQVQASLRHANVVAVTDVVDIDGSPGLVMDYIEGPALDRWLRDHRPDLAQAEAIFRGIVAGVARAHRLGLVHRDLKPANVLMATDDDGKLVPKVADFGLAKILSEGDDEDGEGAHSHTRSGTTMGTPAYMAPEQVRDSKSVDQRADIFALGCILYELVTGVSPFYRPDLFAIFSALASGSYTPPQSLAPDLPARITNTIAGCLAISREHRIHSCSVLLRVLDGEVQGDWSNVTFTEEGPRPSVPSVPAAVAVAPVARGSHGLRILGGLTAAALVAGIAGVVLILLGVLAAVGFWRTPSAAPDRVVVPVEAPAPLPEPVVAPAVEVPPVVAPAPEPKTPVVVAPAAPARPATGTVSATGDADSVWLEGPAGRVELGVVPAGEYRVTAAFKGQAPQPAGRVTVRAGSPVVLSCSAAFQMCQAR